MGVDVVDRHLQRARYGLIVPEAAGGFHKSRDFGYPVSSTDTEGQTDLRHSAKLVGVRNESSDPTRHCRARTFPTQTPRY